MPGIWNGEDAAALIAPIKYRKVVAIADGFIIEAMDDPRSDSAARIIFKLAEPIYHRLYPGYWQSLGLKRIRSQKLHERSGHIAAQVARPGRYPMFDEVKYVQ